MDTFEVNIVDDREARLLMKNIASHHTSNASIENRNSSLPALFKNSVQHSITPNTNSKVATNTNSKVASSRHNLNEKSIGSLSLNEE